MKLASVQILRAFGAWLVAITHWIAFVGDPGLYISPTLKYLHLLGKTGVILFFILSGFIISYSAKSQKSFFRFWIHRLIRLIPLWWFLLFLFAVLLISFPEVFKEHPVPLTIASFLRSLFFLPAPSLPLITQGWSLNAELFFYICFSLALLFKGKYNILICSILLIFYYVLHASLFPQEISANFPWFDYNIYFVYGMLIYYIFENSEKTISLLPPFIFLLTGIYGVKAFPDSNQGLALGLIFWAMISLEPWIRKHLKYFSWAVPLGDWSYSTYLNHVIFVYLFKWFYKKNILSNLTINFLLYALAVGTFSYLTFRFLEKPSGLFLRKFTENVYLKYISRKTIIQVPA